MGKMRSGGMYSPKWRESFERRLRRLRASNPSLQFSHSVGECNDLEEVEMEMSGGCCLDEGLTFETREEALVSPWPVSASRLGVSSYDSEGDQLRSNSETLKGMSAAMSPDGLLRVLSLSMSTS